MRLKAWDKKHNEMLRVVSINFDEKFIRGLSEIESNLDIESSYNFEDIEFLYPTGLKDKYGKDIYQGHIVKKDNGVLDYVFYEDATAGFRVQNGILTLKAGSNVSYFEGEVIGNIYENNELIEDL
ncbi:MAG: YopX family protein [Staphylococcus xylosus]|nr:YopX family protein [Staphylococcus xylosus]